MTSFKCAFEYQTGILSINVTTENSRDSESNCSIRDRVKVHLTFDAIATGARYEKTHSQTMLSEMCIILGEPAELEATLNTQPECKITMPDDSKLSTVCATFVVVGRKKQYPINIVLDLKVYSSDQAEISKLTMKNVKLQSNVTRLENELSKYHTTDIVKVYDQFIKLMPVKCDYASNDFTAIALNLANGQYDQFIQFKLINPNHGIGPFLSLLFKFGDLFYPYEFKWDFGELAIRRLKIMVAHGLDVTQKIRDPKGSWNAAPSIRCIDFVKRTVDERTAEFDKYYSDPAHKAKIDIYPTSLTAILERMCHGYQILADSVRT